MAEHADVDERVGDVQLAIDERRDQHGTDSEFAERSERRPAAVRALDDGVDDGKHRGGGQHGPERVQPGAGAAAAWKVGHDGADGDERDRGQRDVDPEHRAPVEVGEQQAAERRADDDADAGDR